MKASHIATNRAMLRCLAPQGMDAVVLLKASSTTIQSRLKQRQTKVINMTRNHSYNSESSTFVLQLTSCVLSFITLTDNSN